MGGGGGGLRGGRYRVGLVLDIEEADLWGSHWLDWKMGVWRVGSLELWLSLRSVSLIYGGRVRLFASCETTAHFPRCQSLHGFVSCSLCRLGLSHARNGSSSVYNYILQFLPDGGLLAMILRQESSSRDPGTSKLLPHLSSAGRAPICATA